MKNVILVLLALGLSGCLNTSITGDFTRRSTDTEGCSKIISPFEEIVQNYEANASQSDMTTALSAAGFTPSSTETVSNISIVKYSFLNNNLLCGTEQITFQDSKYTNWEVSSDIVGSSIH